MERSRQITVRPIGSVAQQADPPPQSMNLRGVKHNGIVRQLDDVRDFQSFACHLECLEKGVVKRRFGNGRGRLSPHHPGAGLIQDAGQLGVCLLLPIHPHKVI